MTFLQASVYGIVGLFALLVVVYISVRVGSIAHFRSRDEYDRSTFNRYFGKPKGNGDKDGQA